MSRTFYKGKEKLKRGKYFETYRQHKKHRREKSKPGSSLGAPVTRTVCDAESALPASGGKWALPPDDGSVGAHADDVLVPWAYPKARDGAAVPNPDVSHFTLIVIPDFDQMVISA